MHIRQRNRQAGNSRDGYDSAAAADATRDEAPRRSSLHAGRGRDTYATPVDVADRAQGSYLSQILGPGDHRSASTRIGWGWLGPSVAPKIRLNHVGRPDTGHYLLIATNQTPFNPVTRSQLSAACIDVTSGQPSQNP